MLDDTMKRCDQEIPHCSRKKKYEIYTKRGSKGSSYKTILSCAEEFVRIA